MLSQLPPPDKEMLAAGLEGRWFVGIGNHEVWADPKIEGVLSTAPQPVTLARSLMPKTAQLFSATGSSICQVPVSASFSTSGPGGQTF